MEFRKNIFYETKSLNVGDHWRFQHYSSTRDSLKLDYHTFTQKMKTLCDEGWFSAIEDGSVIHYQVLKKP